MCIYLDSYVPVCAYICLYLIVCFEQQGLCPPTTRDYSKYPFTSGDKIDHSSPRVESFHLTVGFLRCFDASAADEAKKIHFNWWDRDNKFSSGVRKAPPYTEIFWILFFKVAANLGDISKEILEASSPEEIDLLRTKTIKVVVEDDGEVCTKEMKMISTAIRTMVDNICYMSVYGHPSNLNDKCPAARTIAFTTMAVKLATENEDKFYEGWKSYRASNPVVKDREGGDESEAERILKIMDDD
jgi:hypothetical protein